MAFETTLPGRYFHDPAIYSREQERIFGDLWICVGRADALPGPGDFMTVELSGESAIVMRGRDGGLRAFLNVCRHRGARLCLEHSGNTGPALQCPYHAWSYSLDGRLVGAPNIARDESLEREKLGLFPVALEIWEGLIWLSLAENPGTVRDQLEPALRARFGDLEKFERYGIGNLAVGTSITYDIAANWKLVVENFMECYHCAPVHPELTRLLPEFRNGTSYQGIVGQGTDFADDIEGFTLSGNGKRDLLPGLLPSDDRLYYGFVLWPNLFVNLLPDHVILHTLLPTGPETARVVCDWLFDPAEIAKPGFDPQDTVDVFDITNRQDWDVCERTQLGMHSRAYADGGFYVSNEQHIAVFRDLVLERIG
ncbi:MAG: aromatic ring-hydroxylating dioxygenase subunit alpha [Chloroflexota bacterium]|nr:aromatic ring-hydroxylating dioxygenase subunit alpha [Chloroflexota bacterium]